MVPKPLFVSPTVGERKERALCPPKGVSWAEDFQHFAHPENFMALFLIHTEEELSCATHIQGSVLMRIITKPGRVGTSLLQSARWQKREGQRQRVRKAALPNALLDPIRFGHF